MSERPRTWSILSVTLVGGRRGTILRAGLLVVLTFSAALILAGLGSGAEPLTPTLFGP